MHRPPHVRRRVTSVVVALLGIGAAGCTGAPSTAPPSASTTSAAPPSAPSSAPSSEPPSGPLTAATPGSSVTSRADGAPVVAAGRVVDVVDGDTLDLVDGTRVRIAIVDAPEVAGGLEECGRSAARFTRDFALGRDVVVLRPVDAPATGGFGRLVGEVVRVDDGASLNVALLAAGLGRIDDRFTGEDPDLARRLRAVVPARPDCIVDTADGPVPDGAGPSPSGTIGAGPLTIVSVVEDGPGNDVEVFGDSEHVVLRNDGDVDVRLDGWVLVDEAGNRADLPRGFSVPAGGVFLVFSGDGDDVATSAWFQDRSQAWLNNGGDRIRLLDPRGATVSTFSY